MASAPLADFAKEFDRCWLCGIHARNTWPPKICIHHIARGPHREKAREERCAMIATCTKCHEARLDAMPIARQLAMKFINDPKGYDRKQANTLRSRAPDSVSEEEVLAEVWSPTC